MSNRQKPKAVVFDLDGLMFNTEELYQHVGAELLRRRGHRFEAGLMDAMMGRPGDVALRLMIDHHGLDCTVDQLAVESDECFATLLDERLDVMPGLFELLAALERSKVPKAIATSSGRQFADDVLGRFSLAPRFEFVLTCEDIAHGKPHPEMYLLAAQRLELEPRDMLVLEDSQNGCAAAVASGAIAVAVPGGHSLRHDFAGAALVASDLSDPRLWAMLELGAV